MKDLAITEADLNSTIFRTYGMTSLPPISAMKLLDSETPEILIWDCTGATPQLQTQLYTNEIYYALSPDNEHWFIYRGNNWVATTEEDFYKLEFTAAEVQSIPDSALTEAQFPDKKIYFRIALISNQSNVEARVSQITATSVQSYMTGKEYIYSGSEMTIDTRAWVRIRSCSVSAVSFDEGDIRFLLSNNDSTWRTFERGSWRTVNIGEIYERGITIFDLSSIPEEKWDGMLGDKLRLCVSISSKYNNKTPSVTSVYFDYVGFNNPEESNFIEVKTPEYVYNRMLLSPDSYIYEEMPVEGIGFDSPDELYNFYTTPNKIVLRILNMGTLIGTKCSEVFRCVICNTYDSRDYNVTLTMKTSDGAAIPKPSHCLLRDTDEERSMTVGEMSLRPPENFMPEYPLKFRLNALERKLFYFRLTPNATTVGAIEAKVVATALEVERIQKSEEK